MNETPAFRPLRWFLLLWVSLAYLWGILAIGQVNPKGWDQTGAYAGLFAVLATHSSEVLLFTALMAGYAVLLWMGLSDSISPRLHWPYFLAQGGVVLVIGFLDQQENVVLSLYLALTLGAISMLKRVLPVTLVASGSVVLYTVSSLWSIWPLPQHADTILAILLLKADYPALIFFVAGYSVLYVQQTRTHSHLEATHRELALAHAKLETAHVQLLASAEQIEALTLMTERQRMARELHDTLAQGLAGVMMQIQAANAHLTHQRYGLAREIMQQTLASARQTLMAARSAIDDLRATACGSGDIAETIREEVDRFSAATGITCHVSGLALLSTLPAAPGEHIWRAISEGLLNVARHAQAQRVWVRVARSDQHQHIEIELQDDGIGFEPDVVAAQTGHYGLLGLRERARLVGGQLEIISKPESGTTLWLRIPGKGEEAPHE